DRGMSLAKVVRDDFSRAFLNQVEMDKTRPSIRLLRVIAERLGTEVEYLLEGHEAGVERELALEKGRVLVAQGEPRRALLAVKTHLQLADRAARSGHNHDELEHYRAARILLETAATAPMET